MGSRLLACLAGVQQRTTAGRQTLQWPVSMDELLQLEYSAVPLVSQVELPLESLAGHLGVRLPPPRISKGLEGFPAPVAFARTGATASAPRGALGRSSGRWRL